MSFALWRDYCAGRSQLCVAVAFRKLVLSEALHFTLTFENKKNPLARWVITPETSAVGVGPSAVDAVRLRGAFTDQNPRKHALFFLPAESQRAYGVETNCCARCTEQNAFHVTRISSNIKLQVLLSDCSAPLLRPEAGRSTQQIPTYGETKQPGKSSQILGQGNLVDTFASRKVCSGYVSSIYHWMRLVTWSCSPFQST